MQRIVPGKIEVKTKLVKNITISDCVVIFLAMLFCVLLLMTSINTYVKLALIVICIAVLVLCLGEINTKKGYRVLAESIAYIFRKKVTEGVDYSNLESISFTRWIKRQNEYTAVIEVMGVDMGLLDEDSQDIVINSLQSALDDCNAFSFVKIDVPVDLTNYVSNLDRYIAELSNYFDKDSSGFETRRNVLDIHKQYLKAYMEKGSTRDSFFIILKEKDVIAIEEALEIVTAALKRIGMEYHTCEGEELKAFLAYFFQDFDKTFCTPKLKETYNSIFIGGVEKQIVSIGRYPLIESNCWAHSLFSIEGVTIVYNAAKYQGKNLEKNMNKCLSETRGQILQAGKSELEQARNIGTVSVLEAMVNEVVFKDAKMYDTQFYIMFDKARRKEILKQVRNCGVKLDGCLGIQKESYINMLPYAHVNFHIKRYNLIQQPGSTVVGAFPFTSKRLWDKEGLYMGYNRNMVFFDVFYKDVERVNGNMCVLGTSGMGKSFTMKKLLIEAACKRSKIFVLDPDDEYRYLCQCLGGNYLDVAGATSNRINPLQVFPSLEEEGSDKVDDLAAHRLFLEQFFKTIYPEIQREDLMYLNRAIVILYGEFGISSGLDIRDKSPEQFPTFNDLYSLLKRLAADSKSDDYELRIYRRLSLYVEQFCGNGLYAAMWNGYTTLSLENRFNVLNFRSLLTNGNKLVSNAQMLLMMRYLNVEIIANLNANKKRAMEGENDKQHILILVDEAHNFINPNFPIALEFMEQKARQIRKYDGVFWLATQNINDFVGTSEETKKAATAVINNCKFSLIFSMAANDINNLIDLYRSSTALTSEEVVLLRSGVQGRALFQFTSKSRLPIKIEAFYEEIKYMEPEEKRVIDTAKDAEWEEYLSERDSEDKATNSEAGESNMEDKELIMAVDTDGLDLDEYMQQNFGPESEDEFSDEEPDFTVIVEKEDK